jgi:hypothetical protein
MQWLLVPWIQLGRICSKLHQPGEDQKSLCPEGLAEIAARPLSRLYRASRHR